MRVEIPVDLLRDRQGDENAELILKLIAFFREARHEWVISPHDVDAFHAFLQRHVPTLAQIYLLLAQKASMAQAWAPHRGSTGVIRVASATLAGDIRDLERPAVLVVENAIYDWQMIEALARLLGCEDVIDAKAGSRLDVYNGGGKDGAILHAVDQAANFSRTKRVVLVIDSDSFHPADRTGNHEKADAAAREGVSSHVLSFREMENYIPNRVLARQPKRAVGMSSMAKRLDSLKSFTPEQRAYFDMKHGFKGKPQKGADQKRRHSGQPATTYFVPPRHGDLYDSVAEQDLITLQEGFGTDLPGLFLQEVMRGGIVERDLDALGSGATQELRSMFEKIRGVI
ncbi:hypothetical protein OG455_16160 [Kitasatospora sp. NBC_01287]|uniref:hypothetical protein n=1 Tax=Kitasatospora sp. NBC_01287 TaxID=2903573 RepID=UPI0022576E9F|nr:hypothetical protein [Kitasatospora sp. NBC_01287]MCX4747043.1 hypothetical protein [Kitasatospora sp. NBC_01287]